MLQRRSTDLRFPTFLGPKDDEPPEGEEPVESDPEDTAVQKALERFEEAVEGDSESDGEGEGKEKKPLPPLPDYVKWRCAGRSVSCLAALIHP